ncbi:tRNA (guanine-N(1)-)-methyltransferase [Alphaproteobacteria bacterium]|nr:tRNA (guanine-N(1)-)-methyltransferase [Alphaproteobacteria bacterium]GHS96247.1 tRNA (guanine-N(1)-)-methyltransferase [Alphaproteobacteria bacterium]
MTWHAHILTLFPEMFPGPLAYSLAGKGLKEKIWTFSTTCLSDFASDKRRTVDDTSYGPNAGLLLKPDIVHAALEHATQNCPDVTPILALSPRGRPFTQALAHSFAQSDHLILLCGRYEGIDERVIEYWRETRGLMEINVGDYILSGGEIAALTLMDACIRLLPGIVHSPESLSLESFELDLLEFPQYTKPCDWKGRLVPEILRSGNHKEIASWQRKQAEEITKTRRPDLWNTYLKKKNEAQGGTSGA